jgi:hypothetical protein
MRSKITILMCLLAGYVSAQRDNVSYHQDPKVSELTDLYKLYNKKNDLGEGYRIQISFVNDRQEAYNNKSKLYKEFPGERCYVEYEQPYYKLRIGDYTTKLQAYDRLRSVIGKYPGAFVVKDRVKIR